MILEPQNGFLHTFDKAPARFFVFVRPPVIFSFKADCRKRGIAQKIVIAVVDHILPHAHAQPVAQIIKPFRLSLNVLSDGIKAQRL